MNQNNSMGSLCPDTNKNSAQGNADKGHSPSYEDTFVQGHIEDIRQLISNMKGYLRPGKEPADGHPDQ